MIGLIWLRAQIKPLVKQRMMPDIWIGLKTNNKCKRIENQLKLKISKMW
jgi:hypothetical protein